MRAAGRLALLWLLGAVVLCANGLLQGGRASAWQGGFDSFFLAVHPAFALGLPAAFCLFGAIHLGLGLSSAVRVRPLLGYAHFAVMLVAAVLMQAPAATLALVTPGARLSGPAAFAALSRLAATGYVLSLASLLLFAYVVLDGWRRARTGATGG